MILGIGVDLTSVSRFKRLSDNERFIKRILSSGETKDFKLLPAPKKAAFLAKRWAAKEAFSKALGCGIGRHFQEKPFKFSSIEILKNKTGAPFINILDDSLTLSIGKTFISFTDEKGLICCFITIEKDTFIKKFP